MSLSESVESTLSELLREAVQLRFETEIPNSGAGPLEVLESLLDCRRRADRIENLYFKAVNIKGKLIRRASIDAAQADDEWAKSIVKTKNSPISRGDSFTGPRERYAEADLEILEFKRQARKSTELLKLAEETVDIIKTSLNGINNTRQDHLSWIRSLQFQSTLEQ